jgi:uncharacterized protein YjbI with pentapeptide repeats
MREAPMNDDRDAADTTGSRTISPEELERILATHWRWLESKGNKGERADLDSARLSGVILTGANLRDAILSAADLRDARLGNANLNGASLYRANLQNADLFGATLRDANLGRANLRGARLLRANLQGANLAHANFEASDLSGTDPPIPPQGNVHGADLTGATLRNAVLRDAQLSTVTGLLPEAFAGTDLANAKLPTEIGKFGGVEHVGKVSEHAGKTFIAVLLGCVYSSIAITTDARLVTNSASSPLPIVGTEIPSSDSTGPLRPCSLQCIFIFTSICNACGRN